MQKTKKSVSKRVRLTRRGKLMRRPMGVDHFKTRKSTKSLRDKRNTYALSKPDAKKFIKYLPHH